MLMLLDSFHPGRMVRLIGTGLAAILAASSMLSAQPNQDPFREEFTYVNNKRIGERLTVSFPNAASDVTKSTEIILFQEQFYNGEIGKYDSRMVAIVTGMGLGTTGLKLVVDDNRQIDLLEQCLDTFAEAFDHYRAHKDDIKDKTEPWMGESWEALSSGRTVGEIYFYPSRKPLVAEFNWDFELDRVWLSMGSRVIVDHEVVPYIDHMLQRLEDYEASYFRFRESMQNKNEQIDELLGLNP